METRQKLNGGAGSSAQRKQKGRREAGLFKFEELSSDEDQYFAITGPPQR